jgi:hypothetical protein
VQTAALGIARLVRKVTAISNAFDAALKIIDIGTGMRLQVEVVRRIDDDLNRRALEACEAAKYQRLIFMMKIWNVSEDEKLTIEYQECETGFPAGIHPEAHRPLSNTWGCHQRDTRRHETNDA